MKKTAEQRLNELRERDKAYKRDKTVPFSIRLAYTTDADVIEKLNHVPNKRQYVLGLIREDIAKGE